MAQIHALSSLDQLPFMRTYTQILLCFPVEQESSRPGIVNLLQRASRDLITAVPILAGQVEKQKDESNNTSGTLRVVPYDHSDGSSVRVKFLNDFTTYAQLREARAPATMLDATKLAPMKGLPEHCGDSDIAPSFKIQANFIPGGLLCCFSGMHSVVDATGLGHLIKLFATLCRGEQLSGADLTAENIDRAKLDFALKPGQTQMNHPELAYKTDQAETTDATKAPESVWSYFNIPASRLAELKHEGSRDLTSDPPWVSTNDVVTAWLWRIVTRARAPNIDMSKDSVLLRAVSGRRQLDPPMPKYLGNIVACPMRKFAIKSLLEESLSNVTQSVREATNTINDHYVRSMATLIASKPNKDGLAYAMASPDRDLMISSWASVPAYEDFGKLLGRADFVRRPTSPWTGIVYVMPQRPDGSLDVAIALPEDDMLRLKNDEQIKAVATYIG
ncbi:MAG: hypothetical protein Q9168_004431 [Polycauliona sp. 1 TL-2023]